MAMVKVLKKTSPDQKTIKFHPGGLHESLGIDPKDKIPEDKIQAALRGDYGEVAKKQAEFMKNVLVGKK